MPVHAAIGSNAEPASPMKTSNKMKDHEAIPKPMPALMDPEFSALLPNANIATVRAYAKFPVRVYAKFWRTRTPQFLYSRTPK